jgi:glycerol-3-phosphate O-acyltransferase / dihydroxyacetone phosphate acyltransferase
MYSLLKVLIRFTLRVFYKEVTVHGKEHLLRKGPLLVAVNHPNTLMDPLIAASLLPQRAGFMAKATFMRGALSKWLFKKFHIVPLYRQQDAAEGQAVNNTASFEQCFLYLADGGTLMIFPEGTSVSEMKLRKLKTGAARIALEFEAQQQFKGNLYIQPVALNYSAPALFRSRVTVNIAEPIQVAAYKSMYAQNPAAAVTSLTAQLTGTLENEVIITNDSSQEGLLQKLELIYKDHLINTLSLSPGSKTDFTVLRELARALMFYEKEEPQRYQSIQNELESYFSLLQKLRLEDEYALSYKSGYKLISKALTLSALLVFGFPIYIAGLISNYLPYRLPAMVSRMASKEVEYRASLMMLSGMMLFPTYYLVLALLLSNYTDWPAWALLISAASFPFAGFFVLYYWNRVLSLQKLITYIVLTKKRANLLIHLKASRSCLIGLLEEARKEYMKKTDAQASANL